MLVTIKVPTLITKSNGTHNSYSLTYEHCETEAAKAFYRNKKRALSRDRYFHMSHGLFLETGMLRLLKFNDPSALCSRFNFKVYTH